MRLAWDNATVPPPPQTGPERPLARRPVPGDLPGLFRLIKWYLDVVTPDGDAVIAYAARLRWGALSLPWASAWRSRPGYPLEERTTTRGVQAPGGGPVRLGWRNATLDVAGEWRRLSPPPPSPPIRRTLHEDRHGTIRWSCRMPRARATFRWGAETLRGLGYAERLELTIPPWRLPFRSLRWGRYISRAHAAVWIAWDGAPGPGTIQPRSWVWLDGAECPHARMDPTAVSDLGDGQSLRLLETRELRNRSVLSAVRAIPGLARLSGRLGAMH